MDDEAGYERVIGLHILVIKEALDEAGAAIAHSGDGYLDRTHYFTPIK